MHRKTLLNSHYLFQICILSCVVLPRIPAKLQKGWNLRGDPMAKAFLGSTTISSCYSGKLNWKQISWKEDVRVPLIRSLVLAYSLVVIGCRKAVNNLCLYNATYSSPCHSGPARVVYDRDLWSCARLAIMMYVYNICLHIYSNIGGAPTCYTSSSLHRVRTCTLSY